MTKITEQLREAAMQILHAANSPFRPTDRLPCTVDELAQAMAAQDLVDHETVEELRHNNQAWQTELRIASDALRRIQFFLSEIKLPMGTAAANAFGCANEALARIDQHTQILSQTV